ncbi:type I 3-dehydroquinase domain-containing protein [Hirsutella rhossiliensis]|uniref:Type I 3-dehydroquinase domain-containing protein n=1 Tax=Hirsutella rhossiliensis TaxID=111463 RepID=A0A9P8SLH5_9HYPO|nr:type I 3-dehydroquinase domain-containing protein [Hirsutella rhossiliensis]KAH0967488.1 type I 3-dehydroquinase domain-containing protein [Hirsutella rhossiliensis]
MAAVKELLASPSPSPSPARDPKGDTDVNDMDANSRLRQSPVMLHEISPRGTPEEGDTRILAIVYEQSQEHMVTMFAEVLGKPFRLKDGFQHVTPGERGCIIGIPAEKAKADVEARHHKLVVAVYARCIDLEVPPDPTLSDHCDYEFLYTDSPFLRRYLARFVSLTLGQLSHHEELMAKPRTYFISTTFPDVRPALPDLDILTVGSDAVEIRVDLLRESIGDGVFAKIPSLRYVGEQVMLLRQRTELPIIFTTRCTNENGKFPMDDPDLYHRYLYKAIQWGVEYIDVELWLPEAIRRDLYARRGHSRIMSAFHDFSGTFRWPSQYAQEVFQRSCPYADLVKMISIINEPSENLELEHFRSQIRFEFPNAPPFSGVNMREVGQISRTLNKVFTPITHPLLPIVAAPGQMSTAEIHGALAMLGQLPKKNIYGISSSAFRSAVPQAPFYVKCFNELGLPHHFAVVERQPDDYAGTEALCNQRDFGGASLDPGVAHQTLTTHSEFFASLNDSRGPTLTEAARAIGIVDTIVVDTKPSASTAPLSMIPRLPHLKDEPSSPPHQSGLSSNASLIFDNAGWRGIMHTLIRDLAPSAYFGRSAVVVASTCDDAAPTFYALKALKIAKIYTVGFRTPPALARSAPPIEQFISMESLQRARSVADDRAPFVIVSALGPEKSNLVSMLVRVFGATGPRNGSSTKVFLNLADVAAQSTSDPSETAERSGFAAYDAADVAAFSTVESLRLLVGQNVPYNFVRLASGRNPF